MLGINVEDYDGAAVLVRGKGNKERTVPLPVGAVAAIDVWLPVPASGGLAIDAGPMLVAVRQGGRILDRRLSVNALVDRVRFLAKAAGVASFLPQDLRRTFATDVFRIGIDGALNQRVLGHVRYETTVSYDHRDEENAAQGGGD